MLVTLQVHLNVVAVASHAELAGVIFSSGRVPDAEVIAKAVAEDLALYATDADTFEVVGRLFALGVTAAEAPDAVKTLRADLHVHTALSPCGDDEMSPPAIVDAALAAGLDMIAVCDHNAAGNARAVTEAAGSRLAVIAGMEITTVEEVHVVGLFPTVAAAANAADEVRRTLPAADGDYTPASSASSTS